MPLYPDRHPVGDVAVPRSSAEGDECIKSHAHSKLAAVPVARAILFLS